MTWTTESFGGELLTKDGKKPTTDVLSGKKIIGLYFSAHWCPPCRGFTPVLGTVYDDMVEEHPEFEIIFISSDSDENGFARYFASMPWVSLPFEERVKKQVLATKYGVTGIPKLIFFDADGNIITEEGRNVVAQAQGDIEKIWSALTQ